MRNEFSKRIEEIISSNQKVVFMTGDLGYNALENVQSAAKERFINAGVAEQNMVGVAAGLAYKGFETFTYSIAPFAIYRCLEQIKIDVCIHNLPVYVVGNGGGYGYGIMGATHHAIEDIACISSLPNMTCWIPAFKEDVSFCMKQMMDLKRPAYLRLGVGKPYPSPIPISRVNKVISSEKPEITIIALGPVVHNVLAAIADKTNIDLFTILTVPIADLGDHLLKSINQSKKIMIVEEHVQRGGLGEHVLSHLTGKKIHDYQFISLNAMGYPSKLYGSQDFHQKESGLDTENIKQELLKLMKS